MTPKANEILSRSPRPLPWGIAMFVLTGLAAYLGSVLLGVAAGISIGAYFGAYQGRLRIMEAWRIQMQADHEVRMAELEARYQ